MIGKFRNFLRLLRSTEPRDQIRLDRRLEELPAIGLFWRAYKAARAQRRQRNAGAYVRMQKETFELLASADHVTSGTIEGDFVAGSWQQHDAWPDYETYLMRYVPRDASWLALEYGCGPGRNIRRWNSWFVRIDGVDISKRNLENAQRFLQGSIPAEKMPHLYLTEGMNCGEAPRESYDFAFSTICLQHICVHEVRFSILQSIFHCLKPGGRLSAQMGFGVPSPNTVPYAANHYAATGTNRSCDVAVSSPNEIEDDLRKIGYTTCESWIRPVGPGDVHPQWIFFTAVKPTGSSSSAPPAR